MKQKALHPGARVLTPDGWGYIIGSTPNGIHRVHLDDGEQINYFSISLRKETFWEFLTKRPGKVGRWSRLEFIVVQVFVLGLLGVGAIASGPGAARAISVLFSLVIEGVIMYGMWRNWKGYQA